MPTEDPAQIADEDISLLKLICTRYGDRKGTPEAEGIVAELHDLLRRILANK